MKRLILCEGKTDAILLGYYLTKSTGWIFSAKAPEGLAIKSRKNNENVAWYKKEDEWLLICAVGGKDNFESFFSRDVKRALINAGAFSHIVIVTDRDDRNIKEIEYDISEKFSPFFNDATNREWRSNSYIDSFGMEKCVQSLLLVIPTEQQGALENVLLSAISEDPYDKNIVEQCTAFVKMMRTEATRYISTDRLELKARLSTVWAIQTPEKAFDFIDEQIKAVEWERYSTLNESFGILTEF